MLFFAFLIKDNHLTRIYYHHLHRKDESNHIIGICSLLRTHYWIRVNTDWLTVGTIYPKRHHTRSHDIHYIISLFDLQSPRTHVFLSSPLLTLRVSRIPHGLCVLTSRIIYLIFNVSTLCNFILFCRWCRLFLYALLETVRIMWLGMAGGRPHRFPHNNFSSVYRIFTKLGHMIPLCKGMNPIYFGVIRSKVTVTINRIFDNRVVSARWPHDSPIEGEESC